MKPPRALSVPFQLGRPFGAPDAPDFQRRVLAAALGLLERRDGPILEDFPDAPPEVSIGERAPQGWACPIELRQQPTDLNDADRFLRLLKEEIALLRPWYDESVRRQRGRRLDGLTAKAPEAIAEHLVGYLFDSSARSFVTGEPIARAIKLCADDLKYFYYQAAMARPAGATGIALDEWFFGQTLAGAVHVRLRRLLLSTDDAALRRVGEMSLVPHTMRHHLRD